MLDVTMETITILLADDHALVRGELRRLLEGEPDLLVVGEAGDGCEAIAEAIRLSPDVVLLDVSMPGMNGLEAAQRIRHETDCRIVMLTMQNDPGYVRRAFESGASGYVLKDVAHSQLVSAVRDVYAGRGQIEGGPPLPAPAPAGAPEPRQADPLSEHEDEVFVLLALGHTNAEIAQRLAISVRTAEKHRAQVMRKLRTASRAELVRHALATGRLNAPAAAS
jgi:two-component system, NarL family, response regulator NreC